MNNQNLSLSRTGELPRVVQEISTLETPSDQIAASPPPDNKTHPSTFWHDRCIEAGLILSMALYYLVGNPNVTIPFFPTLQTLHPFTSLPFLLIFACLSWYRFPFALALLPLSFPYYYLPRLLYQNSIPGGPSQDIRFSLIEVLLWTCVAIAGLRFLFHFRSWSLRNWWSAWIKRMGPFIWPMLLFGLAALISVFIAYERGYALRTFRQEVLGPLVYLGLVLACCHTRQDITRLLSALFGSAFIIACAGSIQYLFFKESIPADHEGLIRLTTVYGSGNSIGLLFDYALPIGLALLFSRLSWPVRIAMLLACIPCFFVLYQSHSRGSWAVAIPAALFIVLVFAMRSRKSLLFFGIVIAIATVIVTATFRDQIYDYVIHGHTDLRGNNTTTKRFYLWQSALHMIQDRPWFGYGMDNWLCYYSENEVCPGPEGSEPYILKRDPITGADTAMGNEPLLSHPHNVLLHTWVSMGIFGLLAFLSTCLLFYWLFASLLIYLQRKRPPHMEQLRWMLVGTGSAMLAALIQGQVDNAFLEQDLSFCFWTLVLSLLLLRAYIGMPWRCMLPWRKPAIA